MKKIALIPMFIMLLAVAATAQMMGAPPQTTTDPKQAFISGSIIVKGEGAAPADKSLSPAQKRIMALRAAKVVALREIAEVIDGVAVSGDTTVQNAAVQSDTIRATVQGMIKGAQIINEVYDPMSEMAVVYLSVPLRGPNGLMGQLVPQVIPLLPMQAAPYVQPPSQSPQQAENYDGLILDVREQPFRPALINRVLSKNGEAIYDPTKVAQNILVERGAAEYTNDVGKAKALLGERGAANPLVVKASGLVKATDIVVGPDEATAIFSSNQSGNYLESAKVVIVLK